MGAHKQRWRRRWLWTANSYKFGPQCNMERRPLICKIDCHGWRQGQVSVVVNRVSTSFLMSHKNCCSLERVLKQQHNVHAPHMNRRSILHLYKNVSCLYFYWSVIRMCLIKRLNLLCYRIEGAPVTSYGDVTGWFMSSCGNTNENYHHILWDYF